MLHYAVQKETVWELVFHLIFQYQKISQESNKEAYKPTPLHF